MIKLVVVAGFEMNFSSYVFAESNDVVVKEKASMKKKSMKIRKLGFLGV